jgi:hypothetical protein
MSGNVRDFINHGMAVVLALILASASIRSELYG